MSILQDIVNEMVKDHPTPAGDETLAHSLSAELSRDQRRRLLEIRDRARAAEEHAACDNYFRGFCSGLWFVEQFLRETGRF